MILTNIPIILSQGSCTHNRVQVWRHKRLNDFGIWSIYFQNLRRIIICWYVKGDCIIICSTQMHASFMKPPASLMGYVPTPCFTVVTDDEEDMADDCWWLSTLTSCWSISVTAGVAGQIATCGTSRAAGGGACCFDLVGCGGNSPDFVAWVIVVPVQLQSK